MEIRSVNSRYFEYSSRLPRACLYLDDRLKKLLSGSISRGKVELSLQLQTIGVSDVEVQPDLPLARSYLEALRQISEGCGVACDVSAGMLARFPDVLAVRHAQVDEEQLAADVETVCRMALDGFLTMRTAEGLYRAGQALDLLLAGTDSDAARAPVQDECGRWMCGDRLLCSANGGPLAPLPNVSEIGAEELKKLRLRIVFAAGEK